jgi:prepilin signal peptidase PulO-like enzyme (type II secretory pathway)
MGLVFFTTLLHLSIITRDSLFFSELFCLCLLLILSWLFHFCYAGRNRGNDYDLRYTSGFWILGPCKRAARHTRAISI